MIKPSSPSAKTGAVVAVFAQSQVLLIQRAFAPMAKHWALPGGRLELGETPALCAVRELKEEMNLAVTSLVSVTNVVMGDFTLHIFATRLYSGIPTPSCEVLDWQWRDPSDLADLTTTPKLSQYLAQARTLVTPA